MGSPALAVPSLVAAARSFDVALVVTQPDRPKGRGRVVSPTPVRQKASELGIEVLTTEDVNSDAATRRIALAKPDFIVVVSFGQILKKKVRAVAPLRCVNVHFSLLPELRGAAPIAWAIIRGLDRTGVSIMEMVGKMDAGPVYARAVEQIQPGDTSASLGGRLAPLGARLLVETLERRLSGETESSAQDESAATYAPKITRAAGAIDWTRSAVEIDRLIRGLSGVLEAYAYFDAGAPVRVTFYDCAASVGDSPGPGVARRGARAELLVGTGQGLVEISEIQAEGRRRLAGSDFANGYRIKGGERFLNG